MISGILNTTSNNLTFSSLNSLPSDKILDPSKLKAFTDDNLNVNLKLKSALGGVEKIVGKEDNAGYQHFLLIFTMFSKGF